MSNTEKPVVWHSGEVKTPPFSSEARQEAGFLLGKLQQGENLSLPHSRPMSTIGARCHELRINDKQKTWRIVYRIDADAIVIVDVFQKKMRKTSKAVIDRAKQRLKDYDEASE